MPAEELTAGTGKCQTCGLGVLEAHCCQCPVFNTGSMKVRRFGYICNHCGKYERDQQICDTCASKIVERAKRERAVE
jgi:hypothetical protein